METRSKSAFNTAASAAKDAATALDKAEALLENAAVKGVDAAVDAALSVANTAKGIAQSASDASAKIEKESPAEWYSKPILMVLGYQLLQEWYTSHWEADNSQWAETTPLKPAVATVVYFTVLYFGMKYMENRQPDPRLRKYMLTYNLYQVLLNLWCVVGFIREVFWNHPHPLHFTPEQSSYNLAFLVWVHYNNKFIELFDTVFMVFNKKNNQVSFLHVYHHVLLMWSWWAVCVWGCGGIAWFGAFMNSLIHVLMYGYYTLAALKLPCPWKKVLTQMQMLQFVLCMSAGTYCMYWGYYPFWLSMLNIWVMVNMLVLFGQFYIKSYAKKNADGTAKPVKDAAGSKPKAA